MKAPIPVDYASAVMYDGVLYIHKNAHLHIELLDVEELERNYGRYVVPTFHSPGYNELEFWDRVTIAMEIGDDDDDNDLPIVIIRFDCFGEKTIDPLYIKSDPKFVFVDDDNNILPLKGETLKWFMHLVDLDTDYDCE